MTVSRQKGQKMPKANFGGNWPLFPITMGWDVIREESFIGINTIGVCI